MLQNVLIALIVIVAILVFFGGAYFGVKLGKTKAGQTVEQIADEVKKNMPAFERLTSDIENLLPKQYKPYAATFAEWVKGADEASEALKDAGQLAPEQRKSKALELVNALLTVNKIAPDSKVKNAISLAIDMAAILLIPHEAEKAKIEQPATAQAATA